MYFITTITNLSDCSNSRCIGYFSEQEVAVKTIESNWGDFWETIYNYAVIENVPEGVYQIDHNPLWFQYDRDTEKYKPIDRPEETLHQCGFGIG
jgi:hypothetical protein